MSETQQIEDWEHYQFPPSFVLGFHGCDQSVGEAILSGQLKHLSPSENNYDWLGSGIYFWESNPLRAYEFAAERASGRPVSRGSIEKPFVLGAIINLGFCLDLNSSLALQKVKKTYEDLRTFFEEEGIEIPENRTDMKVRLLDCAVLNFLHEKRDRISPMVRPYDTVRGTY